jgi:hypothetical protein
VDKVLDVIRKLTSQLVQGCDQGAAKFWLPHNTNEKPISVPITPILKWY